MAVGQGAARTPSLYRKVAEDIKAAIATGGYAAGTRLPSESELAERYSVSRGTIRQAFAALRADGVIASRRGARRVVIGGPRVQSFGELLSFSRWARAMGEVPGGLVVAMQRRAATTLEAERLAIALDSPIYHLTRVRLLSGRPVMIERGAYPDRVGALIADMDMEKDSITERLEELGIVFADAEHVMDAVPASAEDARLLSVRPRVPMLRERRLTTDLAGVPVEWSDDRYLGSAVAFSVHNSIAVNALSRTPARSGSDQDLPRRWSSMPIRRPGKQAEAAPPMNAGGGLIPGSGEAASVIGRKPYVTGVYLSPDHKHLALVTGYDRLTLYQLDGEQLGDKLGEYPVAHAPRATFCPGTGPSSLHPGIFNRTGTSCNSGTSHHTGTSTDAGLLHLGLLPDQQRGELLRARRVLPKGRPRSHWSGRGRQNDQVRVQRRLAVGTCLSLSGPRSRQAPRPA